MDQPYRVIIVDDEPPARDLMAVFVGRLPDLQTVATCANAFQAVDLIQRLQPDLVFLDIHMPQMSGIDLMNLQLPRRPEIILTTAYPDYALKSYEYAVLDYLMKPIPFERFHQAVVKFRDKQTRAAELPVEALNEFIWLREEKRLVQIANAQVLYVEGLRDYVKVFLADQMILSHMTMGKAEELFRPPAFIRIHRSHIVRRSAIRLIEGNRVCLTNGIELLIGPLYREALKRAILPLG